MKKLHSFFLIVLIPFVISITSCSKDDPDYFVIFYGANGTQISGDTLSVPLNTVFSTSVEIQAKEGSNPQFFIDTENITISDKISLTRERFSEVYVQESELNIFTDDTLYSIDDIIEITVRYSVESGISRERIYLKIN